MKSVKFRGRITGTYLNIAPCTAVVLQISFIPQIAASKLDTVLQRSHCCDIEIPFILPSSTQNFDT